MTLNGVLAAIMRYRCLADIGSFGGQSETHTVCDDNVAQRIYF